MARFTGIPPITGTIGPVCIYKMYGRYFIRTRSSLTGKRVKKDPAFRKTMEYARLLAKASRIGSAVYTALPAERRQHALYRKLTGEAMTWLKYEWKEADIIAYLTKQYTGREVPPAEPEVVQIRMPYRRGSKRLKSTLQDLINPTPEKKLPHRLYAYRLEERRLRRQYNAALTTYPWTEYVMT
ncbi:hypothetical protein HB364_19045 [Pseudoflavitalea sp. X16]|uniref:hypothetical protein n=1 Tax=Paraflavitalea devenefica TaxID=2716334 RepID=UPI00141E3182|nr:hypothetical protein [Paraflavitalea devenefica]NII27193.1 hypothetical protein [Paraflavitalea devenefica]